MRLITIALLAAACADAHPVHEKPTAPVAIQLAQKSLGGRDYQITLTARPTRDLDSLELVLDPYNRCADNTLHVCDAGVATSTDCAASGQVCAWVDDTSGYGCVSTADSLVAGTIQYEDKPPLSDGALGPIVPHAARGARV